MTIKIPEGLAGQRLDQALASLFPEYSRSCLQQWINSGQILLNACIARPKVRVKGGEEVQMKAEPVVAVAWQAQDMPLDVVYEDEDILIIDKPAGLVTHPGAGNPDQTLVNALLHYAPELERLPRAGIIHRLDKDTSGLLVIARSLTAHRQLTVQLQAKAFERVYQAVVNGRLIAGGQVEAPIGRHPIHRTRMAVTLSGKPALTHYRVKRRFRAHTHLQVKLETGRTHQIRVHLSHLGHPLVGDVLYGGRPKLPSSPCAVLVEQLQNFPRQALHAGRLGVFHPQTKKHMVWETPLPDDIQRLLMALDEDAGDETGD